jgi:hypothetical protein
MIGMAIDPKRISMNRGCLCAISRRSSVCPLRKSEKYPTKMVKPIKPASVPRYWYTLLLISLYSRAGLRQRRRTGAHQHNPVKEGDKKGLWVMKKERAKSECSAGNRRKR